MRILFISRAYPPVTGGIENQNYALSVWLKKVASADTIANTRGKKFLPFFFVSTTCRVLRDMKNYDVLLLGDGVLGMLGALVKLFYPEKAVVSIVHGLDLTYTNAFYQTFWVKKFLPSLDGLIAVSSETKSRAVEKGLDAEKIAIIPNGVEIDPRENHYERKNLEELLGIHLEEHYVLLTAGRLVKRKGVAWFIRHVLATLPKNTLYVVSGAGPEEANIRKAIAEKNLEDQVRMLGRVSDETRNLLLSTVDIFVQPNISVPGDMEGFGIAVIEATAGGRPTVASNLEGLKDAIVPNENGILVPSGDAQAFKQTIERLLFNQEERRALGKKAREYTKSHYHWSVIAKQYLDTLTKFTQA